MKILIVDTVGNAVLCAAALIAFIWSLIRFFRPKQALYKKMVACALGCVFIERLYGIVQFAVAGDMTAYFQVGSFGNIGCFLFLFSANYGAFDSLVDDGSAGVGKYRRLALFAPAAAVGAAIAVLCSPSRPGRTVICAVELLVAGASAYYSFKHLIIPKRYSDFLSDLRAFHILSLVLAAGVAVEDILWCWSVTDQKMWIVPYLILLVPIVMLAPALERGTKKWGT